MEFEFKNAFELLSRIVENGENEDLAVDISKIDEIINKTLPELVKEDAPPNFAHLYFGFKYEFDKFKDFIFFDGLIGKNVVALGGAFSSGKSTFLNQMLCGKRKILPTGVPPSTCVPAYIISGDEEKAFALNYFMKKAGLGIDDIKSISYGFSNNYNVRFGHLLRNIIIQTRTHPYKNIAFLDTPGYSKPEAREYSAVTDEKIALAQLESSNFILWFVSFEAGTVREADIKFIQSLKKRIPILVIVNKCDKALERADAAKVVEEIKTVLGNRGVNVIDVLAYSLSDPHEDEMERVRKLLDEWNGRNYEQTFTRNFKTLFVRCVKYYEESIRREGRRLDRLNRALTFTDKEEVVECIKSLADEIRMHIERLRRRESDIKDLQKEFFAEIKSIGDRVGIHLPEPSELDLMNDDEKSDPMEVVKKYKVKNNIKDTDYAQKLSGVLKNADVTILAEQPGYAGFSGELGKILKDAIKGAGDYSAPPAGESKHSGALKDVLKKAFSDK